MNSSGYDQIIQTLAPERLGAYGTDSDQPQLILARYLLNMALCESLYSPLQMAEIALRNSPRHLLQRLGIKTADALHLASAVKGNADYFCSCDDRFIRKAQVIETGLTKVVSVLELVQELEP